MKSVLISILLLAGGILLHSLLESSQLTLQKTLIWAGFTPGICIVLGILGIYLEKADSAYQIGRRAFTFQIPATGHVTQDQHHIFRKTDVLSWIFGGLLVCIYSYFC